MIGAGPAAQLAVQRNGQLDWLLRASGDPEQPCQLWRVSPLDEGWETQLADLAPAGSWLSAEASGQPRLLPPPALGAFRAAGDDAGSDPRDDARASLDPAALTALIWHPRTGSLFAGSAAGLAELGDGCHRALHAAPVVAMTLSTDLRRIYHLSAAGELFMTAAVSETSAELAGGAPELLLGGLDRFGAVSGLALGPAGLVMVAERALIGVNIRSRSWAPILDKLAAHPVVAALVAPSVAVDHRRNIYLADASAVVRLGSDNSAPRRLVERPPLAPYC